ncbi:MAG: hypothetical protein NT007_00625 [Candidatus Kapabacteria bacterium]|nr:hypothetical protein [Candidatus Kapabacteria bacterium]
MKYFIYLLIIGLLLVWNFNSKFTISKAACQQEELLEEPDAKKEAKKDLKKEEKKLENKEANKTDSLIHPAANTIGDQSEYPDPPRSESEKKKLYKEKYIAEFNASFQDVTGAIKKAIEETNCLIMKSKNSQGDDGLFTGSITSDFCVFSMGTDSTFGVLKKYSMAVPYVYGGIWENGRVQYKFLIKETAQNKVQVTLKGELSGMEEHVSKKVYFWESNGYFETCILISVKNKLKNK